MDAEPLRERARELLIRALLGLDQRSAALRCYEDGRRLLRSELGIDPGDRLRALAEAICGGTPAGIPLPDPARPLASTRRPPR